MKGKNNPKKTRGAKVQESKPETVATAPAASEQPPASNTAHSAPSATQAKAEIAAPVASEPKSPSDTVTPPAAAPVTTGAPVAPAIAPKTQIPFRLRVLDAVQEERAGKAPGPEEKPADYLTKEAARWLFNSDAIAGSGFAPFRYTGKETLLDLCKIIGHVLTLEEAMILVQPDGEKQTCASEGHEFQPVRFVIGVSGKLEGELRKGVPLAKCEIHYIGSFFKNKGIRNGALLAYSGSMFKPDGLSEAAGSPLVIASTVYAKKLKELAREKKQNPRLIPNRMRGECLDHIQGRVGAPRVQGIKEHRERVSRIESQFAGAKLFGRFIQDERGPMPNAPFARLHLSPVKPAGPNGHEQAVIAQ